MAHLRLVPAPLDHEAEVARLKREILSRGGVRIDPKRARQRLQALGVDAPDPDVMVLEDDGDVA